MPYFTTDDNCRLYYEECGQGRPVVLIHGWSCNRHFWKHQIPALAKRYRVLAFDLRGHGDSDRPEEGCHVAQLARDTKALIDYLGYRDVTLIGWSMGAHIIMDYVLQFGCENISKIVWDDESAKITTDETWSLGSNGNFPAQTNLDMLEGMVMDWPATARRFVPRIFNEKHRGCEDWDWAEAQILPNTPHVMVNLWISITQQDYRDKLHLITVPTLVTYGADSTFPQAVHEYVAAHIPNARLARFRGGHAHHMQDHEAYNQTVLDFIG